MMESWRSWASGRPLWLPLALWALTLLIVYPLGWSGMTSPLAPSDDGQAIAVWSFVPFFSGALALYGIVPRADWIDLQAVTHPHRRDTVAAAVLITAFAGVAPLVGWLWTWYRPHSWFMPDALDLFPFEIFALGGLQTAAVLGATCAMVGLLGRTLGPIAGFACYLGLLTIQGYRLSPALIPRLPDEHPPLSFAGAALTVTIGLAAFRLTRSGTQPVTRRQAASRTRMRSHSSQRNTSSAAAAW